METFLFGVYISATVFLCWHAVKLDEDKYPNKETPKADNNKKELNSDKKK
ncbi:MAG: hypothetical protein ACJAXJ_000023 [Colwellia sp.]|jgi:hypothetical protein